MGGIWQLKYDYSAPSSLKGPVGRHQTAPVVCCVHMQQCQYDLRKPPHELKAPNVPI